MSRGKPRLTLFFFGILFASPLLFNTHVRINRKRGIHLEGCAMSLFFFTVGTLAAGGLVLTVIADLLADLRKERRGRR